MGARTYAEDVLNVHGVHDDATAASTALTDALNARAALSDKLRRLHDDVEQREMDLLGELRAATPDASQAALDRALKESRRTDERLTELREQIFTEQGEADVLDARIEAGKYKVRVLTARMEELAGLLRLYAAVKES